MAFFDAARRDFSSLSLKDLLDARDTYHIHLAQRANVFATAIGRFYIRNKDADAKSPTRVRGQDRSPERTLQNSSIKSWSWPCVLVFVSKWLTREEMQATPEQVIPSFLFLADGRVIPTCVILAEHVSPSRTVDNLTFPSRLIGGGYPILTDVQGQMHVGSLGCLVTDGDSTYALTNAHVTGEEGREVYTLVRGERRRVGLSHSRQIGRLPLGSAYPGWSATSSQLNVDAGLIRLDELTTCTAQVFGIGAVGPLIDLNVNTISLDVLGCPVTAFGGASGELHGQIEALFYRYRSVGGIDYIADMLIGPRPKRELLTRPGDSGTVWFFDDPDTKRDAGAGLQSLRPVALQWGGDVLGAPGGATTRFALATCLSTVCRTLDVELVTDFNTGQSAYWGRVGHYKIAGTACGLVASAKLRTLLTTNLDRIAFDDGDIGNGEVQKSFALNEFAPLADVPDLKWKRRGAAFARPKDGPTHFADMDQEGFGKFAGKTLLDLCKTDTNIDVRVWDEFYTILAQNTTSHVQRGSLPFRVWQIYDEMVGFVRAQKLVDFVCAAGILAHYVGDACQPLHTSQLFDGPPGEHNGVHSAFETTMLDRFAPQIVAGVNQAVGKAKVKGSLTGGFEAAQSIIALVRRVRKILPPDRINDVFDDVQGRDRVSRLFDELGEDAIACMAEGAKELARLWDAAWREGGGDVIGQARLVAISKSQLRQRYERKTFLESLTLREMAAAGIGVP